MNPETKINKDNFYMMNRTFGYFLFVPTNRLDEVIAKLRKINDSNWFSRDIQIKQPDPTIAQLFNMNAENYFMFSLLVSQNMINDLGALKVRLGDPSTYIPTCQTDSIIAIRDHNLDHHLKMKFIVHLDKQGPFVCDRALDEIYIPCHRIDRSTLSIPSREEFTSKDLLVLALKYGIDRVEYLGPAKDYILSRGNKQFYAYRLKSLWDYSTKKPKTPTFNISSDNKYNIVVHKEHLDNLLQEIKRHNEYISNPNLTIEVEDIIHAGKTIPGKHADRVKRVLDICIVAIKSVPNSIETIFKNVSFVIEDDAD